MSRTNASRLLLALLFCGSATQAEVHVSGYLKSFAVAQDSIDLPVLDLPTTYQSQNTLRVMLEGFSDRAVWQVHYEASPVFQSRDLGIDLATFNNVGESYRLTDIDNILAGEDDKYTVFQNLDRFNVQFQFDHGDLTLGRQAISFGSARMINPTDVFLPFDVQTFNTEYRNGVDAIRYQRPWGDLGEIDIGVVFGNNADRENSAAFLQLRTNIDGKDLHFALMDFSAQTLVGTGIQTALGDLGFWFEIAQVSGDEDYVRLSTGLDYAFTENIFGQVEYHHNGAGSDDPDDYLFLGKTLPYQRGGVFLLGEDYLMPVLSIQLSPLWVMGIQAIYNLSDDSSFISVSAAYNVAENFYMDFGLYLFNGNELEVNHVGLPTLPSEYGSSPDTIYTSIRYYF